MKKSYGQNARLMAKLDKLKNIDLTPAVEKGCAIMEGRAKELCPVDTGTLRQSITHEVSKDGFVVTGMMGTNLATPYGTYVEFGTGLFAEEDNGRKTPWSYFAKGRWWTTVGQHPQPFVRPAYYENRDKTKQFIVDKLDEVMKK